NHAVLRGVGAHMPINRTRKHCARNSGHCGGLCGTALHPVNASRRRRIPKAFSLFQVQREHAASKLGIELFSEGGWECNVRKGHVNARFIGDRPPFNTAQPTAISDPRLPNQLSLLVRVDGVHYSRFLTCNECTSSVRQRNQDRRSSKVKIW